MCVQRIWNMKQFKVNIEGQGRKDKDESENQQEKDKVGEGGKPRANQKNKTE